MLFCYNIDRLGATFILLHNNVVQKYCPSRGRINHRINPIGNGRKKIGGSAMRAQHSLSYSRARPSMYVSGNGGCSTDLRLKYKINVGRDKRQSRRPSPGIRDNELNSGTIPPKTGRVATLVQQLVF